MDVSVAKCGKTLPDVRRSLARIFPGGPSHVLDSDGLERMTLIPLSAPFSRSKSQAFFRKNKGNKDATGVSKMYTSL
jgi:hypothetical protein